jgi:hypothetical protein
MKYSASAWSKKGFLERSRKLRRSLTSGGTQTVPSWRRNGSLMNFVISPRPLTGRTSTGFARTPGT